MGPMVPSLEKEGRPGWRLMGPPACAAAGKQEGKAYTKPHLLTSLYLQNTPDSAQGLLTRFQGGPECRQGALLKIIGT